MSYRALWTLNSMQLASIYVSKARPMSTKVSRCRCWIASSLSSRSLSSASTSKSLSV